MKTLSPNFVSQNIVFSTSLATIFVIRFGLLVLLLLFPLDSQSLYTDSFHHYYVGLFLCCFAFLISRIQWRKIILGIGAGLIIDEILLPLYLIGLWNYDYWSLQSTLPVFVALVIFWKALQSNS